jgi:hypothetical protein
MKLRNYIPSEPVDPAVWADLLPPLPKILNFRQLMQRAPAPPPQIIEGVLHQGCKMVLGGTSKSNKSWCLLDMAVSVASGQSWWGRRCTKMPVVYVNFELHEWAIAERLKALAAARPECKGLEETLHVWNLRGHNADLTLLRPQMEQQLTSRQFGLLMLDPAYKLLGDRDENANGQIAGLMNEFEALAQSSGAAVIVAHHFAKGDSTAKSAIDRMSGAGAWARDPDSILVLTPHEEQDCFTVTSILRNLPQLPEFVVEWDYPLMKVAKDLNPGALRRRQARSKVCTDKEFMERFIGPTPTGRGDIVAKAFGARISPRTADRYLRRLTRADLILCANGHYWWKKP